jgi:hypothetical protein
MGETIGLLPPQAEADWKEEKPGSIKSPVSVLFFAQKIELL